MPFSKVYVCDFELDFVSKENTALLFKPIQELKEHNASLKNDVDEALNSLEKVQNEKEETQERV